jgi:putative FmdB family regulatory protein
MPTYEYVCKDCGEQLEVVQSFTDDALTECPNCKGNLRKVYGNVGVTFKGSGFYKTDSRGKSTAKPAASTESKDAAASTSSSSDSTSSGSASASSSDSTPAPKTESKPSSSSDTKAS